MCFAVHASIGHWPVDILWHCLEDLHCAVGHGMVCVCFVDTLVTTGHLVYVLDCHVCAHGWPHSIWLCSCRMVTRPHSDSAATEQMPSAPVVLGDWIDDPHLPVCNSHEGYCWQWQTVPGQQPAWVPVSKVQPVPQVGLLGLDVGPQKPRVILPVAAQREPVALCAQPKAGPPQAGPPAAWAGQVAQARAKPAPPQDPVPPQGPPPPKQQHPAVPEGPRQAQGYDFEGAMAQWQKQQSALAQQQNALQQQAMALHQAAMLRLEQAPRPQQQLEPMPQQQAAVQEHPMPMPCAVQQAVPMQQGAVQQQPGPIMPLPTVVAAQAVWPRGKGAATGTATTSGSAHAYSGSAGAGSGSAVPRTPEVCSWEWPENFHEMIEDISKAHKFFHANEHDVAAAQQHKAEC